MTITCNHPKSSCGIPVILDGNGKPMDYAAGMTEALKRIGWSRADLAESTGKSKRTIDGYWQGKPPAAEVLNVLALELERSN